MRNNYGTWLVRYWNHDKSINDCFGNSVCWEGKARTAEEAVKKAIRASAYGFRFRLCEAENILPLCRISLAKELAAYHAAELQLKLAEKNLGNKIQFTLIKCVENKDLDMLLELVEQLPAHWDGTRHVYEAINRLPQ